MSYHIFKNLGGLIQVYLVSNLRKDHRNILSIDTTTTTSIQKYMVYVQTKLNVIIFALFTKSRVYDVNIYSL